MALDERGFYELGRSPSVTVNAHGYSSPYDGSPQNHQGHCTVENCQVERWLAENPRNPETVTLSIVDGKPQPIRLSKQMIDRLAPPTD